MLLPALKNSGLRQQKHNFAAKTTLAALLVLGQIFAPANAQTAPGDDLRKARIANKIRNADFWDTCRRAGAVIRSVKTINSEESQILLSIIPERPYSIPSQHIPSIRSRMLEIGMSMCAVYATLGIPTGINRSVSRFGERYQLIYRDRARYVYLEGLDASTARVTSWQD